MLRVFYWNKDKKKNVYKTVNKKNFDNDEDKAMAFLNQWKTEQLRLQDERELQKLQNKVNNIEEEIKEIEETEQKEEKPEQEKKEEKPEIKRCKFKLELSDETGNTIAIFGSSKSGKTTQLKEIIKKHFSGGDFITILIAENIHAKIYQDIDKKIIKMDRFDEDLIKGLHKVNKKLKNKYKFCIIFDDIILLKNSSLIMSLICTMRNASFSSILLYQSVQMLAKTNRQNINACIMKRQNNAEAIELLMRNYLGGYEPFYGLSMEDKIKLYREATEDYNFIYLNNLSDEIYFCNK